MSVFLECRPGDEFVCLAEFHASPDGEPFSWQTSRHFRIGERLRFVEFREDQHFKGRPNAWLVVFEAANGARYAATQTYFVTEDCWQGIEEHFRQATATSFGQQQQQEPAATANESE